MSKRTIFPSFFLLFFLFFLPFEKMTTKAHKWWMFHYTHIKTHVIESLYFYISDVILLCFFFGFVWYFKPRRDFYFGQTRKYLFLFGCISFLSLICSSYEVTIWNWLQFALLGFVFLFFCLSQEIFQKIEKKRIFLISFFLMTIFVSSIESAIGISQYFLGHSVGLASLGEIKNLDPNKGAAGFWMPHFSFTIFDALFQNDSGALLRSYGTFGHPNALGGFLSLGILFSLPCFLLIKQKTARFLLLVGMFLQVMCLFTTFSRSALLACFLGCVFWLILYKSKQLRWIVPLFFVFCGIMFSPQLLRRGGVINYNQLAKSSDEIRMVSSRISLDIIKDHPLYGVGIGNYKQASKEYGRSFMIHNVYLLIGAETGIVGLFCFVLFVFLQIRCGWEKRQDPLYGVVTIGLLAVLFVCCFDFYPIFYHNFRYLFFFLPALLSERKSEEVVRIAS